MMKINTEMNIKECPYIVETALMCQTLIREVTAALTWASMKTAIDAIDTVRRHSESMIAEWHHLNPDKNANGTIENIWRGETDDKNKY